MGEAVSADLVSPTLERRKHIKRLIQGLTNELKHQYEVFVPCQTWVVYWITHSLALLEQRNLLAELTQDVIKFVGECAHPDGGYGGGPGQIAHLGTTYAAVNALVTLNNPEALGTINRVNMLKYLHRMKQPNGSFTMHDDGETDSRATYCALAVLRLLNIQDPILLQNSVDWILSCQTFEGGFGSVPDSEAHGGYTFCCVASLCLTNQLTRANLSSLIRWLTNKQMSAEGGFCGRSNKLVDSCYSYWQGAIFPLIHSFLFEQEREEKVEELISDKRRYVLDNWIYDCDALQDYILNQCQGDDGLLRDKPGAEPDFYHTCYALSGLSLSQHQPNGTLLDIGSKPINIIGTTHPLFNLSIVSLNDCFEYFGNKKIEIMTERTKSTSGREVEQDKPVG